LADDEHANDPTVADSEAPQKRKRKRYPREWKGLTPRQKRLLLALQKSMGVVQTACRLCNTSRQTFYDWYHADEHFAACADEVRWSACGVVEMKLNEKILAGDTSAIMFYLRGRDPERWGDRTKVDATVRDRRRTSLDEKTDEELLRIIEAGKKRRAGGRGKRGPKRAVGKRTGSGKEVADGKTNGESGRAEV